MRDPERSNTSGQSHATPHAGNGDARKRYTAAPAVPARHWLTSDHITAHPRKPAGDSRHAARRSGPPDAFTGASRTALDRATSARRVTRLPALPAVDTPNDTAVTRAAATRAPGLPHGGASGLGNARMTGVSPAIRRMSEAATDKHYALPSGTMVIPALGARPAPQPSRARWAGVSGGVAVLLALTIAFTLMRWSQPGGAGRASLGGLADDVSGAPGMVTPAAPPAWQASAGAVEILGAGGAAAPGISAPGTAGAPVAATASAPTASAPTHAPAAATTVPHVAPTATPRPAATATPRPAATATPRPQPTATPRPRPTPTPTGGIRPAPVSPWPPTNEWMRVPGYTPYAVSDPPNDPYAKAFGQCTWYAQYRRPDENLRGMGNAMYWATNARARGYRVGSTPAVNATVVFQPGVQGASGVGHVAHVLILYPDGWFLIAEMNAYGNGGGWGIVSFRYAHTGPGVSFIY